VTIPGIFQPLQVAQSRHQTHAAAEAGWRRRVLVKLKARLEQRLLGLGHIDTTEAAETTEGPVEVEVLENDLAKVEAELGKLGGEVVPSVLSVSPAQEGEEEGAVATAGIGTDTGVSESETDGTRMGMGMPGVSCDPNRLADSFESHSAAPASAPTEVPEQHMQDMQDLERPANFQLLRRRSSVIAQKALLDKATRA
ncbi:unnamed protein product, partial [Chrysoparadoxa australica]